MIGSSSARVEERLTDGDVIVVEVFKEPLLGQGLLGVLDKSLRDEVDVGLITCGGELSSWRPDCSAAVAKDDEEKESEFDGEVEERVTQRMYEIWR